MQMIRVPTHKRSLETLGFRPPILYGNTATPIYLNILLFTNLPPKNSPINLCPKTKSKAIKIKMRKETE